MAELGERARAMMQALATSYANGESPEGPERGIVNRRMALDALMQLFAVIDSSLEAGEIAKQKALHGMCMLMVLREYVLALPDPPGDETLLRNDLQYLVDTIREAADQAEIGD